MMTAFYLDANKPALAEEFINGYKRTACVREGFNDRFQVHMLHDRVLHWGYAKATQNVTWDDSIPFWQWASQYTKLPISDSHL